MLQDLIGAGLAVVVALVVALPLGTALKRCPAVFYSAAALAVAAYVGYKFGGRVVPQVQAVVDVMGKGYLASALFAVVMFTGALDESSPVRRRLQPVRAELSIMSFILIMGHVAGYLPSYLPRLGAIFAQRTGLAVSFTVATALLVIFGILGITSLHALRTRIPFRVWKGIQRMSYLMVALLYAHIALVLGRSAFAGHGSQNAQLALAIYTAVVVLYAVLRVRKALRDRARRAERVERAVGERAGGARALEAGAAG